MNDWIIDIPGAGSSLLSLDSLLMASGGRRYVANSLVGSLWLFVPPCGFSSALIIFYMDPSVDVY
jgi:hypothetical protein